MSKSTVDAKLLVQTATLILVFTVSACASRLANEALSGEEFKAAFIRDCAIITGIEELHTSTWYTVNGTHQGGRTEEPFSLKEMSLWLKECGRDPNEISAIKE